MRDKVYKAMKEKVPAEAVDLGSAVTLLKEHARKSFDETVEIHLNLGVDYGKSDQTVRATVQFPGGAPKQKKIAVFAEAALHAKATEAGATLVGGEELIDEVVKTGKLDADVVIATPSMMPKIAKAARILGPQGLMPNPKTGTVTPDPAAAIKELAGGKVTFKMDALGNIHEAVGKASWESDKIVQNVEALIEAVKSARPTTMKGQLIKSCSIKTTMSPAVRITLR